MVQFKGIDVVVLLFTPTLIFDVGVIKLLFTVIESVAEPNIFNILPDPVRFILAPGVLKVTADPLLEVTDDFFNDNVINPAPLSLKYKLS